MVLRVFIGCEESGVGRRAFQERGHICWSNDLLPARDGSDWHRQGDLMAILRNEPENEYDLGIFHPDCTSVCVAGNRTYAGSKEREDQVRWIVQMSWLAREKCRAVCIENPASVIWPHLRKLGFTVQFVQPYEHGHMEQKKTGLALWNLPPLVETNNVKAEMMKLPKAQRERVFFMSPGENRKRDRSESYPGIMAAMADQWGAYLESEGLLA